MEHLANFIKTKTICNGNPSTNLEEYGIADTGATQSYIRVNTPCSNKQKIIDVPQVILSEGSIIRATKRPLLNLNPLLNQTERIAHIFPHLPSGDLISIGQLCDYGCIATFTATHLSVVKDGLMVLEGRRSYTSGMWQVKLTSKPTGLPS